MTSADVKAKADPNDGNSLRCAVHIQQPVFPVDAQGPVDSAPVVESLDASASLIASSWTAGAGVSAAHGPPKSKSGPPTFESAGFVTVAIDLAQLPLAAILAAPFTRQYCGVAAHPPVGAGGDLSEGVCLLAFPLPTVEADAQRYALMQAGLEARYRGSRMSSGVMQVYALANAVHAQVLGHGLNAEAVRMLIQFGVESKALARKPDEILRSKHRLDLDSVIRTEHGDDMAFGEMHEGTTVYCPVHADVHPAALIFRLPDGRPVLACTHCQRAFTVRDASNDYDFGQFDRTVRELAATENVDRTGLALAGDSRQFDLRQERYLSELTMVPGIMCVKSPKGSGKTEALVKLIERCKRADQHVLLLGHRRTLLLAMAQRLSLWCYIVPSDVIDPAPRDSWEKYVQLYRTLAPEKDSVANERRRLKAVARLVYGEEPNARDNAELRSGEPRFHYAVSMDSLTMLDPKRNLYDVVIIDEAEQVFSHLVGTTLRDRRREVFNLLRHYLRVAKTVILLDADLGMVTMDALFAMDLKPEVPVSFIINDYRQDSGDVLAYPSQGQLVERLHTAVAAGEKCYVAANSKNKVIELEKALAKAYPTRRIRTIHADNASNPETQALLRDINHEFERNIDVLIASPALGTGIDITFKDVYGVNKTVVQHVFGMFRGNITTHMDIDQQLMRVRQPGQVHVWVDPMEQHFETDIGIIKHQLARTVGETRVLLGYKDDGSAIIAPPDGLVDIWARVRSASRGSKNRLDALFRALREDNGWRIVSVGHEPDERDAGIKVLAEGKALRLDEREQQIMAADILTHLEAAELEKSDRDGKALTLEDRAALERYRIENFYSEDVSAELIAFDEDGRMRPAIRLLEILLASDVVNAKMDQDEQDNAMWVADLTTRCVKARLLREVLAAAGMYDTKGQHICDEAMVEQENLGMFIACLRKNGAQFQSVFNLKPRKDADRKRVAQLGALLQLVGLGLGEAEVSDIKRSRVRRYGLDLTRLERLRAILLEREAAREAKEERKQANAAENAAAWERAQALQRRPKAALVGATWPADNTDIFSL